MKGMCHFQVNTRFKNGLKFHKSFSKVAYKFIQNAIWVMLQLKWYKSISKTTTNKTESFVKTATKFIKYSALKDFLGVIPYYLVNSPLESATNN